MSQTFMKAGIISDIHGDLKALKKALALLKSNGAERIICAGDVVEKGPHNNDVVNLIREHNVLCVQGNHDTEFLINVLLRQGVSTYANVLSDDSIAYLKSLPERFRVEYEGVSLFVTHACPWNQVDYLYPHAPAPLLIKAVDMINADILVVGHTHRPMGISVKEKAIINPGSVSGEYAHGSRTCGILQLPEATWQVFLLATGQEVRYSNRVI